VRPVFDLSRESPVDDAIKVNAHFWSGKLGEGAATIGAAVRRSTTRSAVR
jgi:hypothetical protein